MCIHHARSGEVAGNETDTVRCVLRHRACLKSLLTSLRSSASSLKMVGCRVPGWLSWLVTWFRLRTPSQGREIEPSVELHVGLHTQPWVCLRFSLSPFTPPPHWHTCILSLSQRKKENLFGKNGWVLIILKDLNYEYPKLPKFFFFFLTKRNPFSPPPIDRHTLDYLWLGNFYFRHRF